jgi:chromosome partitioning protein
MEGIAMRRIAVINQKGGVGKTTTTVNLAAALARKGQRVVVIDLDPQAHASAHLGLEPDGSRPSMYNALVENVPLASVRQHIADNLWLMGADINLAAAEMELAGVVGREVILRDLLEQDASTPLSLGGRGVGGEGEAFDYLLMDCGPSLGVLTLNALACADEVLIPLQPHYLALHGLSKLLETTSLVAKRINPPLIVSGIVLCLYESTTKLAGEVVRDLEGFLAKSKGFATPWSKAEIFATRIRRNIKLAECPSFGKSIFDYAPSSNGAEDYAALADELQKQNYQITSQRVAVPDRLMTSHLQTPIRPALQPVS